MSKKNLFFIVAVIIVVVTVFFITRSEEKESLLSGYTEVGEYSTDQTLSEPLTINSGEAIVLEDDATLTVNADVTIDGALGCREGGLRLEVEGILTINDSIICEGDENSGGDIIIIAKGGLMMSPNSNIVAGGNVQIVDSTNSVRTDVELNALYDEVENPTEGQVIGPFVEDEAGLPEVGDEVIVSSSKNYKLLSMLIPTAHAQVNNGTTTVNLTGEPIVVSGKIKIDGPPRVGARRIVVFDFPNTPEVTVQDFELEGPDGRPGDPDSGSCDVEGKDGEDAFRFNAFAPSLKVNNFTLTLGSGGEGGEATTGDDCENAKAKGGKGGKPGNFRMIGSRNFEITGAFMIHPGNGGDGGGATAKGKNGDPSEKGGDANATGGKGSDNKKKLTVSGTVAGTSNVAFGDAVGGIGGSAFAEGGAGGDADKCGMAGGIGGNAVAKGGKGGDAKLSVSGGAGRMEFANDIGGAGGLVEATGGAGGAGGSCDETATGGDGGKGGSSSATEGKGGMGKTGRASDGGVFDETGGAGGNGGDGCVEGKGGKGGSGDPDGEDGEDGTNICITITKEEDYISLLPGEIRVIQYMDYYIPITNLVTFADASGNECDGEEHWHPGPNGAINTMGYSTPDPDPNGCGFGKTSDVPVQIIQDPNYKESSGGEDDLIRNVDGMHGGETEGVEMIQIDPPTLVIPAY